MTQQKAGKGLDFEAVRLGIELCDPEFMLGFYVEDAKLGVVNASAPQASSFELRGKVEIARYLRATCVPQTSRCVEREVVGEKQVRFWEACEYSDGSQVVGETALELRNGKFVPQVDVMVREALAVSEEVIGQRLSTRKT